MGKKNLKQAARLIMGDENNILDVDKGPKIDRNR